MTTNFELDVMAAERSIHRVVCTYARGIDRLDLELVRSCYWPDGTDDHGGYSGGRYVASFVGMVPASRPRLVVLVMVDEPHGAIWGGVVAAPAFAQIAAYDLQYLEVPPDGVKAVH